MDKTGKKSKNSKKVIRFGTGTAPKHFGPKNNIPSDVLGSYTGTARDADNADYPDLYPVQDADDL